MTIADRVYPLSVAPEQEEALRASAKKIEAMIKQLEQNYAVRDKQDVLSHVCVAICNSSGTKPSIMKKKVPLWIQRPFNRPS